MADVDAKPTIPREGEIVPRNIPFEFPDDIAPIWHAHREWSHLVNGASLTMPYLEPFLIATLKEAADQIDDEDVLESIRGFNAQEAQHYKTHRRYNELLKANGYEELAEVERGMKAGYDKLRRRSLEYRLAYSAGFETMTLGVTRWLVAERRRLFGDSDTRVASFILWHFVEEAEHKRSAFDAYRAVSGRYWQRAFGVFAGAGHVAWWARKGAVAMLKKDGVWWDLRSRLRYWRRNAEFLLAIAPSLLRSLAPGHDPRDEPDPEWVREWIAGYARSDQAAAPMVDTSDPLIPVPFAVTEQV